MNYLAPVLIMSVIFGGSALIIFIIASFNLRNRIVKAGTLNIDSQQIKSLFDKIEFSKTSPLKWGLILFFGGIGLIIINFVPYDQTSTLPWGIEVVCLSLGYLLYYFALKSKEVSIGDK